MADEFGYNIADEFNIQRQRLRQEKNAESQRQENALKRRLASQGRIGSGEEGRSLNVIEDQLGKQFEVGSQNINAAEMAEKRRRGEILQGQKFAANQADIDRKERAQKFDIASKTQQEQFGKTFEEQKKQFILNYELDAESQLYNNTISGTESGMNTQLWTPFIDRMRDRLNKYMTLSTNDFWPQINPVINSGTTTTSPSPAPAPAPRINITEIIKNNSEKAAREKAAKDAQRAAEREKDRLRKSQEDRESRLDRFMRDRDSAERNKKSRALESNRLERAYERSRTA